MIGEFFLDHGIPASLAHRVTRVLLMLGICGLILFISFDELDKAKKLVAWREVPCTIIESNVQSMASGGQRELPYHVSVQFQYKAGSRTEACTDEPSDPTNDASAAY